MIRTDLMVRPAFFEKTGCKKDAAKFRSKKNIKFLAKR